MIRRALLLIALLLGSAIPSTAQTDRSLTIRTFDAEILVRRDGTLSVTERIRVRFEGSWNGIYRTIPVEYRTPQGLNYTLFLEIESVTDDSGTPLRHEASRDRHYRKLQIWVPGATDATRTIVLRYRVLNGLRHFDEHDELYWNVTGDESAARIESASARIYLPPEATGIRATAYSGVEGSREQADVSIIGNGITYRTLRPLDFREGLTVVAGWDPGVVQRPTVAARAGFFLRSNWPFLIPLGLLILCFAIWRVAGRDPRLRPIEPRYDVPAGLTPAELGTLLDNSPDIRDITASLVDLAVRGHLTIEEREDERLFGLYSSKEYVFRRRTPAAGAAELQPHERKLLDSLFRHGTGNTVRLSDLENEFYKDLPAIRDRIFESLVGRGYYRRRPDKVVRLYSGVGMLLIAPFILAAYFVARFRGQISLPIIIAAILSIAIIILFARIMPKRTSRGARTLEDVLGFEEFLGRVDGDRLRRMIKTPELFEKNLAYAMALGVEKSWARAFEDIYTTPPDWYRGGSIRAFHAGIFVAELGALSSRAGSTMASSPRSSGGSGFGGGGGAGGGFGGGGVGGF